jgi:transposase
MIMGKGNFCEDFKLDAINQIALRSRSVADALKWLGVSTHSLCGWMKRYAVPSDAPAKDDQAAKIRRLKQELSCVTGERDLLKRGEPLRTRTTPRMEP